MVSINRLHEKVQDISWIYNLNEVKLGEVIEEIHIKKIQPWYDKYINIP